MIITFPCLLETQLVGEDVKFEDWISYSPSSAAATAEQTNPGWSGVGIWSTRDGHFTIRLERKK